MTNEEINRAISTWFEPMPSGEPESESWASPTESWCYFYASDELNGWNPPDYFKNESANARLLDKMHETANVYLCGDNGWGLTVEYITDTGARITYVNPSDVNQQDRKTAVVLAFCKFAGLSI